MSRDAHLQGPQHLLLEKIAHRRATVGVIGLGYVGLPLAVAFAEAGFPVVGVEKSTERLTALQQGHSYIEDIPSERLARCLTPTEGKGGIAVTQDPAALGSADASIICVQTPLAPGGAPDISAIVDAADSLSGYLRPGGLVVLESTTYPGTTREVVLPLLERKGLRVGEGFFLAYSPERIDPGNRQWTVQNTPKVVGGVTPACTAVACALYQAITPRVVPVSSPTAAEMVKLLENTFRAVNIALVNEVALLCERLGVDVWEIIEAAKTKPFGFMPFYPGPGVGGHCIPKDFRLLAWKAQATGYTSILLEEAYRINASMPEVVVERIAHALAQRGKPLAGAQVLVLGVAYKPDVGDTRDSPAVEVIRLLRQQGAQVSYHDPYVPALRLDGQTLERARLDTSTLEWADCVVVTTAHSAYDWEWVVKHSRLVVDTRNATAGLNGGRASIVRLGVGEAKR
ncbi:MAG: nucleotide sugar dehydrogenase [Dehalococcoidia bacterium]